MGYKSMNIRVLNRNPIDPIWWRFDQNKSLIFPSLFRTILIQSDSWDTRPIRVSSLDQYQATLRKWHCITKKTPKFSLVKDERIVSWSKSWNKILISQKESQSMDIPKTNW